MKAILFVVLVLGLTVLGSAQTAAPAVEITSHGITTEGDVTHLTGLTLRVSGIRLTADEADANKAGDLALRGNVLLHIERGQ